MRGRTTWVVAVLAVALWVGSWRVMYLEITRWHHVKPNLAFNSDLRSPTGEPAHPGAPLMLLYVVCATAPIAALFGIVVGLRVRFGERQTRS